jgi:hypothetical protein
MNSTKYVLRLDNQSKIEVLLQETYDSARMLVNEINDEMNKLRNSTKFAELDMESKGKYAKAMHDYTTDKQKAIGMKLDIAKFMGEVRKYNGDASKAIGDSDQRKTSLNLDELRRAASEIKIEEANQPVSYKVK